MSTHRTDNPFLGSPEQDNALSELESQVSLTTALLAGLVDRKAEIQDDILDINTNLSQSLVSGDRELSKRTVGDVKETVSEYYLVLGLLAKQRELVKRLQAEHSYLCVEAGYAQLYAPLYAGTAQSATPTSPATSPEDNS